ncbi:GMC family oxidoreductase [Rhodococcus qingshengii]|uniref:GMC family oxidoreductase n=1 Tax=Rhodococcus qingshengii TaxID=334542 RepID=UPI003601857D
MTTQPYYDVIVVGAGSSGAALGARLAERGQKALLLEAGRNYASSELPEEWRSPNPAAAIVGANVADFLWADHLASRTASQEPSLYWRGKGVGGSSTINGQIAIRPPVEDFDEWVRLGCSGWSSTEVMASFVALESDSEFGDDDYHGRTGPIPIYRAPTSAWGSVDNALREVAVDSGYGWAPDVNAPGATGVSPYPINSRDHRRISCNDAYLEPLRQNSLLTICGGSLVDKILFEGTRAIGVQLDNGRTYRGDRIVLSAGATASPSILMRSGIGPAVDLEELGIDVRVDLPVGRSLQDHPMALIGLPLTAAASAGPNDRHSNCCVRYASGLVADGNDMMMVSLNQNALAMASADVRAGAGAVGVFVNRTYSRGRLRLQSSDPTRQPRVELNMLSDDRDLERLLTAIRSLGEMVEHDTFRKITDGDLWRVNRALRVALDGPESGLRSYLRDHAVDTQHASSTCPMGNPDDEGTVVDPECRVLGLQGLHVVDASIFPFVPRANTHLTCVMAGEHMANKLS